MTARRSAGSVGAQKATTRQKSDAMAVGTASARKTSVRASSAAKRGRRKFLNEPVEIMGIKFDSKAEAARYVGLAYEAERGKIRDLEVHPKYRLEVNGQLIGTYRPDFQYVIVANNQTVVEDVKSKPTVTEAYKLRKKLMRALYNIDVVEVIH